jgi:short-subunit dehydrogenase
MSVAQQASEPTPNAPSIDVRRYGPAALVTGASSGIGEAFCRHLAAAGFELVITARRGDLLETLAAALRAEHGVRVHCVELDLTRADFIQVLLAACSDMDIGLVISNAGYGLKGLHHENDGEALAAMIDLNCRAPVLLSHALIPRLLERGRGGLLMVGSIEAYVGFPYSSAYAASKSFTMALGEGLWGELEAKGVDVLVLNPGATNTEIIRHAGMNPEEQVGLMEPAAVAKFALEAIARGPVRVPGMLNRVLVALMRSLPRRSAIKLMGRGMRDALEAGRKQGRSTSAPSKQNTPPGGGS